MAFPPAFVSERRRAVGEHVHVRIGHGLSVSEHGELIESSRCRCGATWTKTYRVDEDAPEE